MTSDGKLSAAPAPVREHFNIVHMLRGVAALWVVLFHIHSLALTWYFRESWPEPLYRLVFEFGRGGIAVFFVLSGCVIAQSLHGKTLDWRGLGQFAVRRSLRLDPPYFASIALALAVTAAFAVLQGRPVALPGIGVIAAHLVYLQELLRMEPISVVFWTLTYEIQFYLVFALLLVLRSALERRGAPALIIRLPEIAALLLAFYGAAVGPGWALYGLFANYWYAFFLGVLVQRAVIAGGSRVLVLLLAAVMLATAHRTAEVFNTPAALTGLALLAAGIVWRFQAARAPRTLMGLGTISYSLYLTHYPVLLVSLKPAFDVREAVGSVLAVAFQLACVLAAALAFWWAIERPSQRWAQRFKIGPARRPSAAPISEAAIAPNARASEAGF
ncbi:MAG: hypothetical protein B7Z08_00165 [Sphingomonadales bacterium 32-68-7]|nr:MAG: hypothetical protein B7Z33_09400 [Sphingomonadales bacterium 12-68-11]OYX10550.1 MAG: hypothetical protein B7Z08_00165 [Sphingomonadales bacterium 32-68-7]